MIYKLILLFTLLSCGDTKVKIPNTEHNMKLSGSSYNYIIVRLEFIKDIERLCNDLILYSDYPTYELYKQAVAQCTFDKLSLLDVNMVDDFKTNYCNNPSSQDVQDACNALENT